MEYNKLVIYMKISDNQLKKTQKIFMMTKESFINFQVPYFQNSKKFYTSFIIVSLCITTSKNISRSIYSFIL